MAIQASHFKTRPHLSGTLTLAKTPLKGNPVKQKLHKDLQNIFDFFHQQRSSLPDVFGHKSGVINKPTFYTLKDFQADLNNPLLKPEWAHVKSPDGRVELEKSCFYKTVQGRNLDFMDKTMLNNAINGGAAVVLEGIDILSVDVNQLASKIDQSLPCVLSNPVAFFSQKDNEAYEGHCDADDVLVIQIEGRKTWQLFEPQQRRYAETQNLSDQQLGPVLHEVAMRPGDAMYLRAGVPHRCVTPGNYSFHLSIDLTDNTPPTADIAAEATRQYNHACELPYVSSDQVIDRYVSILDSAEFKEAVRQATDLKKQQILEFRASLGNAQSLRSLNKFN
ncbi:MAG: hypothetical protein ACI845_004210 [Gammaproteobacteria bacterium]